MIDEENIPLKPTPLNKQEELDPPPNNTEKARQPPNIKPNSESL